MLVGVFACFLMVIHYCHAAVQDTRLITIRKTIHKNESLIYNITDLFPGLIKDPSIEYYTPESSTEADKKSNASNFVLSEAIMPLYNVTFTNLSACTAFMGLDHEHFIGTCSSKTTALMFKQSPAEKKVTWTLVFTAPEGETIESSASGYGYFYLYFLCKKTDNQYSLYAVPTNTGDYHPLNIAFDFTLQSKSEVTLKVGRQSGADLKRLFVFSTVSPVEHFKSERHPTEFTTVIHEVSAKRLRLEGHFSSEMTTDPLNPNRHEIINSYERAYEDSQSFLAVLPFERGIWILNSVTHRDADKSMMEVDKYMLQLCHISNRTINKTSYSRCASLCAITSYNCTAKLEIDHAFCKFNFENLREVHSERPLILELNNRQVNPELCGVENCTSLFLNCTVDLAECEEESIGLVEEPSAICTNETTIASMCLNIHQNENLEQDQFFRAETYDEEFRNSIYLLTNCRFTKATFKSINGPTFDRSIKSGSYNFVSDFVSGTVLAKGDSEVLAFLRPYKGDNATYLTVYNEDNHTARVFQYYNQSFKDDSYALLIDQSELHRDFFVSVSFDPSNHISHFTVYNYSDQTFSLNINKNLSFTNGSTLITTRLNGECFEGSRVTYQFEITVLECTNSARAPPQTFGQIWHYPQSLERDDWIEIPLPVDVKGFAADDPEFKLAEKDPGVEIYSKRFEIIRNQSVFIKNNQRNNILFGWDNVSQVMVKEDMAMIVYKNRTASIMQCRFRGYRNLHHDPIACTYQIESIILPETAISANTFLATRYVTGEYHAMIILRVPNNGLKVVIAYSNRETAIVDLDTPGRGVEIDQSVMYFNDYSTVTILVWCSKFEKGRIIEVAAYGVTIPLENPTAASLQLQLIENMKHPVRVKDVYSVGIRGFALVQYVEQDGEVVRTIVSWIRIFGGIETQVIEIEVEETFIYTRSEHELYWVIERRLIMFDKDNHRMFFRMPITSYIKQLDTNVRPIYEGVLPVPGLDTNGDSIKDLVDIDVIQGIFIMGLNRSETDTANITKQFIDIYVVDMRGNDDDPIGRLRLKMTVEVPPYNGPLLVLQYLDPVTLRIHALICFEQGNIHVVGELHGSKATLKILPSKLGNGITERNMRYSGSACNESDSLLVPLKIVAAEWDDVIVAHATSNPYDLENNETSILEIESHLINIASHRAGYDVIAPESFKGTFEVIPMIVPDKRVSSLILPQPFQFKAEDKIFVHDDAHLLIRGKNSVTIFKIDSGRPPILLFNKTYSQNVLTAYMTYDPKMNYKVRGSGPLEFVFVLLKGDYDKNDVDMNVYDSTNFTSTAYYTDKDVGYCDCIRFEVIKRNQEIFSFSVHCRTKRGSGTTWTLSMVDLIPTNTDDKSITGTILGGFKPGDPYNGKPFQMKYKPLDGSGYGMMRPTSSSTLSYYFFDNMGQVGLMYFGNNKEVFGYHTFSTTCVLRQDTSISCRIFEQDMDLGCIVLCDQVRIESFKVRIRVDELDTENNEALTGVKVIKEEGYKIPINHKVLHLQKGETFDFVVTETSDKNQSVLMYDTATGLILYRMNASEICPKENPGCKLDSLYIHQFGDNRILLLPEGGQLDNSMFIWQKPQLNFSRDQLRKSGSLKEFKLVINSVTTKETNKMISILDLFKPKQEDFFWVYLAFVIVLAIFLVLCFLLLLYMNWRAEERAQVRKEDKEREKNSGLDRVNRMSKQDYKEVPSEKENNRTSLLPQPSVAADTNRTSLYKKKTIKL